MIRGKVCIAHGHVDRRVAENFLQHQNIADAHRQRLCALPARACPYLGSARLKGQYLAIRGELLAWRIRVAFAGAAFWVDLGKPLAGGEF